MGCFGISREELTDAADSKHGRSKPLSWFPYALGAFLGLGSLQTMMSVPSRWAGWEDTYQMRVPLLLTGMALANLVIRMFQKGGSGARPWGYVLFGVVSALVSQRLMFWAIDLLAETGQAGLAFPVAINACVLGFAAYSLFWIKEPTNRYHLLGMAMGFAGILLMTWPD
jgi:multidrug transporter EmrE-like cation transporter